MTNFRIGILGENDLACSAMNGRSDTVHTVIRLVRYHDKTPCFAPPIRITTEKIDLLPDRVAATLETVMDIRDG